MSSPASAFNAAEEAALRASTALRTAMGGAIRIYHEVPTNAPLPYVVLGQHEIDPVLDGDDSCGEAWAVVSTVNWWAALTGSVKGSETARAMGAAIYQALRPGLTVAGFATVLTAVETPERYSTDADLSTHGLLALRHELTALEPV
jgi:hypothetical protein